MDKERILRDNYLEFVNKIREKLGENQLLYNYLKVHFDRIDNFTKKQPLKLAIVGEYNAGKTTFINRLLGLSLPSGRVPTTKIITVIKYGDKHKIEIEFKDDGKYKRVEQRDFISINDMNNYLNSPDNDLKNIDKINEIRIYTDNEILKSFEIIDTPGFNDVNKSMKEATQNLFDKLNFVIFVFTATQVGKGSEIQILEEFRKTSPYENNIYAFVNQADLLEDEKDIEKIKKDLKNRFGKYFVNKEFLFVSCKKEDEKWKSIFEKLRMDLKQYILDADVEIAKQQIKREYFIIHEKIERLLSILKNNENKIQSINKTIQYLYDDKYPDIEAIKGEILDVVKQIISKLREEILSRKKSVQMDSMLESLAYEKTLFSLKVISHELRNIYIRYLEKIDKSVAECEHLVLELLELPILQNLEYKQDNIKARVKDKFVKIIDKLNILKKYQKLLVEGYILGMLMDDYIYKYMQDKDIMSGFDLGTIEYLIKEDLDTKDLAKNIEDIKDEVKKFFEDNIKILDNLLNLKDG